VGAPEDLGERAMLGDAGANALGALLGTAAAATLPRAARVAVLAAILGLTAASEVVSFTKVIEQTPPLRWLDMLGRRPAAPRAAAGQEAPAGEEAPAGPGADAGQETRPGGDAPADGDGQPGQAGPATAGAADGSAGLLAGRRAPAAAAGP